MIKQEPLRISQIDLTKIVYPKSRSNQNKKIILIKYNEKNKLTNFVFQSPTLLNLSKPQILDGFAEIEVGLEGKEKNKVNKFINFLSDLETKIKKDAQFNAADWFNLSSETKTINFQKIIRDSDDNENGTLKIKIIKNNDFETYLQLNNNKRISAELIPEDSWCKMILECYAIWVNSNNDFGIFFRPILISFTPKEKIIYNYNFVEDSDEENDFEIPDTEINTNLFYKIDQQSAKNKSNNDSTSQLEFNELFNQLESEEQYSNPPESPNEYNNLSESFIQLTNKDKEKCLDINIDSSCFSNTSSTNTSPNSDAETCD